MASKKGRSRKKRRNDKAKKDLAKKKAIQPLPTSVDLLKQTVRFIAKHYKMLLGLAAVYGLLYLIFVRARVPFDLEDTKTSVEEWLGGNHIINSAALTGLVVGLASSTNDQIAQIFSTSLLVGGSLAYIWSIRRLLDEKRFRIRDAYYRGMYPLIPYVLVSMLLVVQLIPFSLGGLIYGTAADSNLIVNGFEQLGFAAIWFSLTLVSLYWVTNTIIAMYAVTLPDIDPMQALRASRKVLKGRRWLVLRRVLMLPVYMAVVFGLFLLAVVAAAPGYSLHAYDLILVVSLPISHIYLFKLYRALV